ncbi:Inorganic pyrophosphatase 2, mitochondrial [Tetrabaena socialis]|uniref:inorganic diphosphatase n=1 Tax=Tetrabaena socialis TaxID=47790 RepID=A0A2J8ACS6_9CHLO|nr:Inorganic pyrophosphatase 2, mitochondrial [Tetrabaena socialis]|eukprot:PNH10321.1 Inorganic pyrophosphatase 2, mitochondrial [Tetrabaena socialis]
MSLLAAVSLPPLLAARVSGMRTLSAAAEPDAMVAAASTAAAAVAAAVGHSNSSRAVAAEGAGAARATTLQAPKKAPLAAAASNVSSASGNKSSTRARPGEVLQYRRIVPGPKLTGAADPKAFEVYDGCRSRAYGKPGNFNFTVYCENSTTGHNVSFWHEIPLDLATNPQDGAITFWVTNEIPRGTNAKIETVTTVPHNPMAQNVVATPAVNGTTAAAAPPQIRFYRVGPSLVNYGGIPQTWEASDEADPLTGLPADNDPLDFIEIGAAPIPVGGVVRVKLLGALSLVDQGETDWKMVVINVKDPNATKWDDIIDVPAAKRQQLYDFFRTYKVAEGKQANHFTANTATANRNTTAGAATQPPQQAKEATTWQEAYFGRDAAAKVLRGKYAEWQRLLAGGCTTPRCTPLAEAAVAGGISGVSGGAAPKPGGKQKAK